MKATQQQIFNRAFCRAAKKADVNDMAAIMAYVQELELLAQQNIEQVTTSIDRINLPTFDDLMPMQAKGDK